MECGGLTPLSSTLDIRPTPTPPATVLREPCGRGRLGVCGGLTGSGPRRRQAAALHDFRLSPQPTICIVWS
jgi:hypothetical protein